MSALSPRIRQERVRGLVPDSSSFHGRTRNDKGAPARDRRRLVIKAIGTPHVGPGPALATRDRRQSLMQAMGTAHMEERERWERERLLESLEAYRRGLADAPLVNMGGGINTTATTLTVDNGGHFAIGQTIVTDSEQMLVRHLRQRPDGGPGAERHHGGIACRRCHRLHPALAAPGRKGHTHQHGTDMDQGTGLRAVLRRCRPGHGRALAAGPFPAGAGIAGLAHATK